MLITAGVRAAPGLFMVPLESEFGWSRAVISASIAVNIALFGLIGPFAASVMDRWGVAARRAGRAVGGQRHGAASLPAATWRGGRVFQLAIGGVDRGRGGGGGLCDRVVVHARSARGRWTGAVRPGRRRAAGASFVLIGRRALNPQASSRWLAVQRGTAAGM